MLPFFGDRMGGHLETFPFYILMNSYLRGLSCAVAISINSWMILLFYIKLHCKFSSISIIAYYTCKMHKRNETQWQWTTIYACTEIIQMKLEISILNTLNNDYNFLFFKRNGSVSYMLHVALSIFYISISLIVFLLLY